VSIITGREVAQMPARFGAPVLRRDDPLQDAFDALGWKIELNDTDAATISFPVLRD
jgi:hypothetical protein